MKQPKEVKPLSEARRDVMDLNASIERATFAVAGLCSAIRAVIDTESIAPKAAEILNEQMKKVYVAFYGEDQP